MKIEIKETMDGSQTLYVAEIDEHYHSTFGAVQESRHVFIREGFDFCRSGDISILEIGFGTGLNCYLTFLAGLNKDNHISYYSIEKYPLPEEIWERLNYPSLFQDSDSGVFTRLHSARWNCDEMIGDHFLLHKMNGDLLQSDFIDLPSIDLVYFDAFSPEKQPELWERAVFEQLYLKMKNNGILVTYCAKGYVRRSLQEVGFSVERISGPPGKREMIRAVKRNKG